MVMRGKTDVAIGVSLPKTAIEQIPGRRDIHVYRGDLQLHSDRKPTFNIRHRDDTVTQHGIYSAAQSEKYSESEQEL